MQKEAIYVLATYNLECFDYLLRSFAIGLKQNCLGFVEKQLQEMIEKVASCIFACLYMYNRPCYNAEAAFGGLEGALNGIC